MVGEVVELRVGGNLIVGENFADGFVFDQDCGWTDPLWGDYAAGTESL